MFLDFFFFGFVGYMICCLRCLWIFFWLHDTVGLCWLHDMVGLCCLHWVLLVT
ncbi:hypothetical protein Hdeb2414_s0008g00272691 [Helianthus debilis subsp. tardiflorus]